MEKILFPTDFSEAAHHAFLYALKVAEAAGASIVTVHAYQLPEVRAAHLRHTMQKVYESVSLEEFENYRDEIPVLRQIAEDHGLGHVPITHIMLQGDTVKTIVGLAAKEKCDLIVMGTKGAGWLREIFVGAVAAEVMEHAPCPVLAVPRKAYFDKVIDHIAITTDYEDADVAALRQLIKFADIFGAKIYCVHFDTPHIEALTHRMEKWKEQFKEYPNVIFAAEDTTDLMSSLSEYLENHHIDLVAMRTEKRGFWAELFHYSKAKKMIFHSRTPVLAIPQDTLFRR